jgi:glycosyltransferase involved in cell wall biosynthesis
MKNILVVTNVPPWPTTTGSAQRTKLLIRSLRQHGNVDFFLVNQHRIRDPAIFRKLRDEFGLVGAVDPWGPPKQSLPQRLRSFLRSRTEKYGAMLGWVAQLYVPNSRVQSHLERVFARKHYDLIVGRYLRPTAVSGALEHRPVVLDLDDFAIDIYEARLRGAGSWRDRWVARRALSQLRTIVPHHLRACAHIWVTSRSDQDRVGVSQATILSNIPFIDPETLSLLPLPIDLTSRSLLVVAGLKYPVNLRAVDRFIRAVWPRVHDEHPGATIRIVGSGMTNRQRERWSKSPGVVPVGFVDDLRSEYEQCLFTVVPIFAGGGTKIKVAESLLYGRTIVLSTHALRGYQEVLRDGESVRTAADEEGLVEKCLELLNDPTAAAKLAQTGHALVRDRYTFDHFSEIVGEAVAKIFADETTVVR